jgi:hypothetical protein
MFIDQDRFQKMCAQPDDDYYDAAQYDAAQCDDDSSETLPCPNCAAEIYEDAERCPNCGEYVTPSSSLWAGRPAWWIILGILGILATIIVLGGIASIF